MSFEYSSVIAASRSEVFDWFARPGALTRLSPPWQPMVPIREAESLPSGRAVIGLPAGLRWVARHDPEGYLPQQRFVDEVVVDGIGSLPTGLLRWRHTHEFEVVDEHHTRVVDRVDTPVPERLMRPVFDYRYRQLADDLAAHADAIRAGFVARTIAVSGASGLVGSALCAFLGTGGHTVVRLVRGTPQHSGERQWNPDDPAPDLLDGVDAVVHLAGASIAGRFTDDHKRAIVDSRVGPTERLAEAAVRAGVPTFVSASAIGYYGYDRGDEQLRENATQGSGFLADLVNQWEWSARQAADAGVRVVLVRTGIVQTPRGGTLRLLRPLFAAGLGGRIGDGTQWLSWIGIDDLVDIYYRALWDNTLLGPVNAVAPQPVRNSEYTAVLARTLHRPALLPVPGFGPALLLGKQGARELAAASQRVIPARLESAEHRFRTPELAEALGHLLGRGQTR